MKYHFIIIEHNSYEFLKQFINSISNLPNTKITIFDNNSNYNVRNKFQDNIEVITSNENLGYGKAVNIVGRKSNSEYLFICNSDLIFLDDTFEKIDNFINENPKVELFGIQQLYPDKSLQYSYGKIPSISELISHLFLLPQFKLKFKFDKKVKVVKYIDGAFIVIKNKAFQKINGFDEDYYFYSEDADLCYRASKLGIKSYFNPKIKIIHYRNGSSDANMSYNQNTILFIKGRKLFITKHYSKVYIKIYIKILKFNALISYFYNCINVKVFMKKRHLKKLKRSKLLIKTI